MQTTREDMGHEGSDHDEARGCDEGDLDTYIDEQAEALAGQRDERW